jgi:S-adenosylmethionine:tRNA ribosyltransferase-isomerase
VLLGGTGRLVARLETVGDSDGVMEIVLYTSDGGTVEEALEACGTVPLPPYLRRETEPLDVSRYQTVYAKVPGAVAAPTAGLHLSTALLDELGRAGIRTATLTLHVGLGTFRPVTAHDLDDHKMHEEAVVIPPSLVAAVRDARARRAAVVAVGTTVVRGLETAADPEEPGAIRAMQGRTNLLIQPGFRFRVVDAMLTNFHLPRSTLVALVAAFAGRERTLGAYREAIRRGYRFYSYGDAMFIPQAEQVPRSGAAGGDIAE